MIPSLRTRRAYQWTAPLSLVLTSPRFTVRERPQYLTHPGFMRITLRYAWVWNICMEKLHKMLLYKRLIALQQQSTAQRRAALSEDPRPPIIMNRSRLCWQKSTSAPCVRLLPAPRLAFGSILTSLRSCNLPTASNIGLEMVTRKAERVGIWMNEHSC